MSANYLHIGEIKSLFFRFGYNERKLDLDSRPGMISRTLDDLRDYARETTPIETNPDLYQFYVPGLFNGRQDRVDFMFSMFYNPVTEQFKVSAMSAKLGDVRGDVKSIYLFTKADTWVKAGDVYQQLDLKRRYSRPLQLEPQLMKIPFQKPQKRLWRLS